MKWAEIAGVIIGCTAVLGPVIKWLISDWFKKAKEIERLKAEQTKSLLDEFRRDINSLGNKIRALEATMTMYSNTATKMQAKVETVVSLIDETIRAAENISHNLESKIKDQIKTEIIKLKENLIMVRNKGATSGK